MIFYLSLQIVITLFGYHVLRSSKTLPQDRLGKLGLSYLFGSLACGVMAYVLDNLLGIQQSWALVFMVIFPISLVSAHSLLSAKFEFLRHPIKLLFSVFKKYPIQFIFSITGIGIFWIIAKNVVYWGSGGGIFVSHASNYGDINIHLQLASFFLNNPLLPPEAPYIAGHPLRYPFMVDYLITFFASKESLVQRMQIQSFLLFICIVISLRSITLKVFEKQFSHQTRWIACLAPLFILCFEPGLEVWLRHQSALFIDRVEGIELLSLFYAHFIPQRGMLLGFPMALLCFSVFLNTFQTKSPSKTSSMQLAMISLLSALVFLAYPFCFIWLILFVVPFCIPFNKSKFFYGGLTAFLTFILGMLLYPTMFGWQSDFFVTAFKPHLFWMTSPKEAGWFWLSNLGFVSIFLFLWGAKNHWRLFLTGLMAFILTNSFQWRPSLWDNNKILICMLIVTALLFSGFMLSLFKQKKYVLMACFLLLWGATYSRGFWRVFALTKQRQLQILSSETTQLAKDIPNLPEHILLYTNELRHPCILQGCVLYRGYAGHLFALGHKGWSRRKNQGDALIKKTEKEHLWIARETLFKKN